MHRVCLSYVVHCCQQLLGALQLLGGIAAACWLRLSTAQHMQECLLLAVDCALVFVKGVCQPLRDWRPRKVSLSRGCALVWLPHRKAL
jgi:hypothetical protein